MPENKPRICSECGAEYPADNPTYRCYMPTGLGTCGGKILPPPSNPEPKEKP